MSFYTRQLVLIVLVTAGAWLYAWLLNTRATASLYSYTQQSATAPDRINRHPVCDGVIPNNAPRHLFYFIHVTDLHVSHYHTHGGATHLEYFLQHTLPRIHPDFVVVTGDLTDAKDESQLAGQQYEQEWIAYRDILTKYDLVNKRNGTYWRDLRGNHDCFSVPDWYHEDNFYRKYGVQGNEASYIIHDSYEFGRYSFIALDGCPKQGASRHLNFFGNVDTTRMDQLEFHLGEVQASNHSVLLTHYPTCTIRFGKTTRGESFFQLMEKSGVSMQLNGHLHRLAFGIGDHLQTFHERGEFLELELPDLKLTKMYRIIAVDHDLVSVKDMVLPFQGLLKKDAKLDAVEDVKDPVVMITNPKDASTSLPTREPWWRMQASSHVRVLVWTDHVADSQVFINGEMVGVLTFSGTSELPLYTHPWNPQHYRTDQEIHVRVRAMDDMGRWGEDEVRVWLDGRRQDIGDEWGRWIMNGSAEVFFQRIFFYVYSIVCLLLLVPKTVTLLSGGRVTVESDERQTLLAHPTTALERSYQAISYTTTMLSWVMAYGTYYLLLNKQRLLAFSERRVWYLYWMYMLAIVALPWYITDLFRGRSEAGTFSRVYLQGVLVGEEWVPVLDTWSAAAVDLLLLRVPAMVYVVCAAFPLGSGWTQTKLVRGWVVVCQVMLWWLNMRMMAWLGYGYGVMGFTTAWWQAVETYLMVWYSRGHEHTSKPQRQE